MTNKSRRPRSHRPDRSHRSHRRPVKPTCGAGGCQATYLGTNPASYPQIARKPPIGGLTTVDWKRAVAPEVGRGSACARSGEIAASCTCLLLRDLWVGRGRFGDLRSVSVLVGLGGSVAIPVGFLRAFWRFCITPLPYCV